MSTMTVQGDVLLPDVEAVWKALEDVKDPEIPPVSLVELGVIRDVSIEGDRVVVQMTPTFAGCPAQHVMRQDAEKRLRDLGFAEVEVSIVLSPPWTTDWISPEGRAKLEAFGIAPPPMVGGAVIELMETTACPHCGSTDATLKNAFGPTLCRTIWFCNGCDQPFEGFKPI